MTDKPDKFIPSWGLGRSDPDPTAGRGEDFFQVLKESFKEDIGIFFDLSETQYPDSWHKKAYLLTAIDGLFDALEKLREKDSQVTVDELTRQIAQHSGDIAAVTCIFNFHIGGSLMADSFVEAQEKGELFSREKADLLVQQLLAERRKYFPNRVYTQEMFDFFKETWDKIRSQEEAFDLTAAKFQLDPTKMESFLVRYRKSRPNQK